MTCRGVVKSVVKSTAMALLVGAWACGSSPNPAGPSGPAADVTVAIQGDRGNQSYSPNPVTMRAGQTIGWKNNDAITHTAAQDAVGFNTGNIAPGGTSASVTMNTAGTFTYHCAIHPGMVGTITVQ